MSDKHSEEAQELAYGWSFVGMPLEAIAQMHIEMQRRIAECCKIFEGMARLCSEGPQRLHWSEVLDLIRKEVVKGCDICEGKQ